VLDFVDCPDRRLARAAADLVCREAADPGTHVTVILPRRSYPPLLGRLMHDRTADKIARVISRIPRSAATIIPYDVQSRLEMEHERETARAAGQAATVQPSGAAADGAGAAGMAPHGPPPDGPVPYGPPDGSGPAGTPPGRTVLPGGRRPGFRRGRQPADPASRTAADDYGRPVPPAGSAPIGSLTRPGRATVVGRVHSVEIRPAGESSVFACTVADSTGELTALFYGRQHIAGVEPGVRIRLTGAFGIRGEMPVMINPNYELLSQG